jgi:hypothetical protein
VNVSSIENVDIFCLFEISDQMVAKINVIVPSHFNLAEMAKYECSGIFYVNGKCKDRRYKIWQH